MGEPLLAAYLQTLLDKLGSGQLSNFAGRAGFKSELRTWRSKLLQVRRVLCDAEEKQRSDTEVKKWLDNLRDLAYNADDVLEELRHEALQRQNNSSSDSAATSSQVQDLLAQIKEITTTFLEIEEDKNDLGLKERPGVESNWPKLNSNEITSLVDSSQIVGREKDVDAILKLLDIGETSKPEEKPDHLFGMGGPQSSSTNKRGKLELSTGLKATCSETLVIPIVGMGGVGKTTLAQCIYNHSTVKNYFEFQAWVDVSDNFDMIRVTKALLKENISSNDDNLNELQERLKENISRKSFLIVLDDIWNEDDEKWEKLFIPLKFGPPRSAVIVTTRSSKVALVTGTTSPYELGLLEEDECLSILARHALRGQSFDAHRNLKVIGEEMVKRCDGLPLAAKILGRLLRDQDQAKWEEVYGSSLWTGSISEKIAPVLGLSFNYLPSHLKQCFAYCSVFPKDYEFDEEDLIFRWMAEGFLGESNEEKQMEDGHKYFHLLLSRSLLQRSSHDSTEFVMHDLIHDLAQIVAGKVCFRIEKEEAEIVDVEAVRHLSFCLMFRSNKEFEGLKNTKRLRTLLALQDTWSMNQKWLHNLLPQLRYLRVLSLNSYGINELPSSVGDLKHLRYLNLSHTQIKLLPESLYGLQSLQFLILKGCCYFQQLPLRLKGLANLRYLAIPLRYLYDCIIISRIGEVSRLGEEQDIEDALVINLMNKKNIEELRMTLRELVIEGDGGVTLSNWICDSSYLKLVELSLMDCRRCKSLPSLGHLPLLKKLTIERMSETETIGTELFGEASPHGQPFPSLAELCIENCGRCKSLSSLGQLPLLKNLTIKGMPKIETIGTELDREASRHGQPFPSLTELRIEGCKNLWTLPDGIMSSNSNLQVLVIRNCESLESFGSGVLPSTLKKLYIWDCRKLKSISEMLLGPTSLEFISFFNYPNLKSLLEGLCTNLTYLCIDGCESIKSVPETPNLTCLRITNCENLKYLPSNLPKLASLEDLFVKECDNLVSLPEGGLPPSLQVLKLGRCAKVEKQMWDEWGPHKLPCLTSLSICGGFRDAVWFPFPARESQSLLPPTLTSLSIDDFPNLESLSSSAFRNLTSLGRLQIWRCPKLQSLPIEALPPSLESLNIAWCPELKFKCEVGGEYWARLSLIPSLSIDHRIISYKKIQMKKGFSSEMKRWKAWDEEIQTVDGLESQKRWKIEMEEISKAIEEWENEIDDIDDEVIS